MHLMIDILRHRNGRYVRSTMEGHLSQLEIHRGGLVRSLGCKQKGALCQDVSSPHHWESWRSRWRLRFLSNTQEFWPIEVTLSHVASAQDINAFHSSLLQPPQEPEHMLVWELYLSTTPACASWIPLMPPATSGKHRSATQSLLPHMAHPGIVCLLGCKWYIT